MSVMEPHIVATDLMNSDVVSVISVNLSSYFQDYFDKIINFRQVLGIL